MRAYSASSEESLLARNLLKEWTGKGFVSEAQYQRMEPETSCELRRTNIFLRVVLFLFTLIIVGSGAALFIVVFHPESTPRSLGIFLLIFAAVSYALSEVFVSRAHLYRFGVEEALAACSVGFLCAGIYAILINNAGSPKPGGTGFVVPAAGVIASLWIWHRFRLPYATLAAMIFVLWLPRYWTSSHSAQHLIVAAFYAGGLFTLAVVRVRHRFAHLNEGYSIAGALLWLGIYVAINLQLSSGSLIQQWWGGIQTNSEFSITFYWVTWILTWCIPPAALWRGLRRKDRFVIDVGGISVILTLITNKPYLGWQRHTWDPMLLGALFIGVALYIRRWLSAGPGGNRHGFTAQRLFGKEKHWLNVGSTALGLISPHAVTPSPQPGTPDVHFGGGDAGGGGASSDF